MPHDGPVIDIAAEMKTAYLDYAMSVIVSRAIPDLRDGLKPVHRRILFAMNETGNTFDKSYRKSARPVGDVMGNYHPHGDAAIYDAMARLAQVSSLSELSPVMPTAPMIRPSWRISTPPGTGTSLPPASAFIDWMK